VGFRVKSDLRNHQAIVQPRLYDSLMVTQITLKGYSLPASDQYGLGENQSASLSRVGTDFTGPSGA
jgi:hypothetical protein